MATSKQKIRVYVSKVESIVGESMVVSSNLHEKPVHNEKQYSLLSIKNLSDEDAVTMIKKYMIKFFSEITDRLEKASVKFDVDYFFNREYSAKGQLIYHDKGESRYFHQVYWVDLIKPLSEKEIELFVKALWEIPFLGE